MRKEGYPTTQFIKDYWLFLDGHRFSFLFFTLLRSSSVLANFGMVYFLGKIVDFFTTFQTGHSLSKFYLFTFLIGILGVYSVWMRVYSKFKLEKIGAQLQKEIRVKAMQNLMNFELSWHEKEAAGAKLEKIDHGAQSLTEFMHLFSNDLIGILTDTFAGLFLLATLSFSYFLYGLFIALLFNLGLFYFNKRIVFLAAQLDKSKEKISGKFHESISNLLTIKALGLKEQISQKVKTNEEDYYRLWLKAKNLGYWKIRVIKGLSAFSYAGFILLLGLDLTHSKITVGFIVTYAAYFNRLITGLDGLSNNLELFITQKSGVGRLMTILDAHSFKQEKNEIPENWKKIEFVNVTFSYKHKKVLQNFNLTVNRGEKIGLVGRTGSGKSTLFKLLLGLYKPQKGDILIDGMSVKKYDSNSLAEKFSIVLQESELFNTSLLENITIATNKENPEHLKKSILISQLETVIKTLPSGLHTLIGEKGYRVSGGERQRIGLARALYKDSSLLLLDEATSHLDSQTEYAIQKELEQLKDKTLLIIAHRLSTIKNVNKIIVLAQGKIIEEGTFNELAKKQGLFSTLSKLQRNK